jgi:hypothetical protein
MIDTSNSWFREGETQGTTVYEYDEITVTKLLGPNGKPYELKKQKIKLGFDLTIKK